MSDTVTYLADAVPDLEFFADGGLLREVHGHRCVAGPSTDPTDGRTDCLVEYAPTELLTDPVALTDLVRQVTADRPHGQWRDLVIRAAATVSLPPPLTRDITHLEIDYAAAPDPQLPTGLWVAGATEADDDHIRRWLRQAAATGARQRRMPLGETALDFLADACLTAPDRVSFVVRAETPAGSMPVAHATLHTEARDDLLDQRFVELVDILVADGHDTRLLTAALVGTAAAHAASAGMPLVGNVVHGRGPGEAAAAQRVVRSLIRQGWHPLHTYWRRPLRPGTEEAQ